MIHWFIFSLRTNWLTNFYLLKFITDALLADLQNSVPGSQQNPLNPPYTGQNGSASSGYGSLRSRQSPQSVRNAFK